MGTVHVALANYDPKGTYSRHVGVAMVSIIDNTTSEVCFHIMHDVTLTEENRLKLLHTVENAEDVKGFGLKHKIEFHNVTRFYENCTDEVKQLCKGFSIGTTYYLNLPEILPTEKKVILVDSDTITTLDITELWSVDLGGRMLGAVSDLGNRPVPGIKNPAKGSHINTGVQLIALDKIRAANHGSTLLEKCFDYMVKYKPTLVEQEFTSAEFYGKIAFLDNRFNYFDLKEKEDLDASKIWHFAGRKPWIELVGSNAELLYWKYLQKTPWRDETINAFYVAATNGGHLHRHTKDCINKMKANIKGEIKRAVAKLFGSKKFMDRSEV